jgi:hypothetical protein
MLLEEHYLFDVVYVESNWLTYAVVILPDFIRITPLLAKKLDEYVRQGRILATGESGLLVNGTDFALDLGAKWLSTSPYRPHYFIPEADFGYLGKSSFVMYSQGQRIEASGETLGLRENPYFNRDVFYFCSPQACTRRQAEQGTYHD